MGNPQHVDTEPSAVPMDEAAFTLELEAAMWVLGNLLLIDPKEGEQC